MFDAEAGGNEGAARGESRGLRGSTPPHQDEDDARAQYWGTGAGGGVEGINKRL